MGLTLRTQRDGTLRPFWYAEYREADSKRKVVNLSVKWTGTPPASGRVSDPGDKPFERSREKAQEALARFMDEARHKGRTEHLIERLIESKTGASVQYIPVAELCDRWLSMTRDSKLSKGYSDMCRAIFGRFAVFMQDRNPKARFLYQVKPDDANAFAAAVRDSLSPKTYREHLRLLRPAFDRFLPAGAVNPFRAAMFKKHGKTGAGESIHRKPFTPEELQALVDAANGDGFMGGLITAAACTGLRRGDVCRLKWADVDLPGGMLTVKTSKTGAAVEIPIFAPLRAVLDTRKGNGSPYVFPEAVCMLNENPGALTYAFKKIIVRAFEGDAAGPLPKSHPAADIEAEGARAIREHVPEGTRRDRMLDTLARYAAGASVRDIEKATGRARATVSLDLSTVENWTGKRFVRSGQGESMKSRIARVTRVDREQGQNAASVHDWPALRTTFVTLALSAGVPLELVRRVTGHATVEIVLKYYFRPDREQFRAALVGALPDVLTGGTATKPKRLKPADELAALAGKLAAGTATKEDRARLRKLAGRV